MRYNTTVTLTIILDVLSVVSAYIAMYALCMLLVYNTLMAPAPAHLCDTAAVCHIDSQGNQLGDGSQPSWGAAAGT